MQFEDLGDDLAKYQGIDLRFDESQFKISEKLYTIAEDSARQSLIRQPLSDEKGKMVRKRHMPTRSFKQQREESKSRTLQNSPRDDDLADALAVDAPPFALDDNDRSTSPIQTKVRLGSPHEAPSP